MGEPLKVGTLVRAATVWLRGRGDPEARITVELLLGRALGVDRAGLYARFGEPVAERVRNSFEELLARRAGGEPVAYILGEREFYGLSFVVRTGVLVPRPESELLVNEAIDFVRAEGIDAPRIADVGTGSGAVAIALAVHLPRAEILALEISPEALEVARENVARQAVGERVRVLSSDLLGAVDAPRDVVVGNLPYIPSAEVDELDPGVKEWEPRLALDGGDDGLSLHRRLIEQLPGRLRPGGLLALEIADNRGEAARELFDRALPDARVEVLRDVFDRDRVVRVVLP